MLIGCRFPFRFMSTKTSQNDCTCSGVLWLIFLVLCLILLAIISPKEAAELVSTVGTICIALLVIYWLGSRSLKLLAFIQRRLRMIWRRDSPRRRAVWQS